MTLADLGWNDTLIQAFTPHAVAGLEPARVVCELRRNFYAVHTAAGEVLGECGGKFFHKNLTPDQFPAVGDWVAVKRRVGEQRADLHCVLPRHTKFSRRASGSEGIEQIIAANIDTVLLVSGLDCNFNPKRIQRFLVAAKESGAEAIVILNKSDICEDAEQVRADIQALVPGVPVFITSTHTRKGLKELAATYAQPGKTLAFIGSSGVGKSSLINALIRDDFLPTGEVREKDSKGRHTTTRRELVLTPSGALVIDTPGMRELQLWGIEDGVEEAFSDIKVLAAGCRFTNCGHSNEPGCAVLAALKDGTLAQKRWANYEKLRAEKLSQPKLLKKLSPSDNRTKWRKLNAERDAWKKNAGL